MGFVGNLLGMGDSGMNFKASTPGNKPLQPILNPTTLAQAQNSYGQTQSGLNQQQNFVNALMGSQALGGQNALAQQLQGVANGTGPNPALQQLQNTTGQNVANQAALMAGQRGSGANAGLLARQIGQQGAGIQQQAVGQGAALQAQQQLSAMGALQNLYGQQVGQQQQGLGALNQFGLQGQQNALNSIAQQNNANVGMQSNINNANAGIAGVTAQGQQGLLGGALGGIGSALGLARGGEVKKYDLGGSVDDDGSKSFLHNFSQNFGTMGGSNPLNAGFNTLGSALGNKLTAWINNQGGDETGTLSANAPNRGMLQAKGGVIHGEKYANSLKPVPGTAKTKGDNLKNDTVPAMLSPGEVIIPRSIMQSKDPVSGSAKFVQAVMAKHMRGKK